MDMEFSGRKICLLALIFLCAGARAEKRVYDASRLTQPLPVVDGRLDDSVWRSPEGWQGDFVQYAPNEGQPATHKTRFKIVYDDDNLYAAIMCYDEPGQVRRIFAPRDEEAGDFAGFAFDSYFNHQTAYEFDLTAAGQKNDVMYLGGPNNFDSNWNPIWEGATALNDSGWAAEFKIPFSQLRYHNVAEQTWGLHVWRTVSRNKEENHWNLMPSTATAGAHNFGIMRGISGIRSSRQTELLPYFSLKSDYQDGLGKSPLRDASLSPAAGLDAKIGISSDFTLDATFHPDFGQVEADPAVLNLTAYETYFDEKRPFFLEGKDIFDYKAFSIDGNANQLFYSRRIGNDNAAILGSGKLTGRTQNGLSIGVLETVTGSDYATVADTGAGHRGLTVPYTNYFSSRVRKESADGNTHVGASLNSISRRLDGYGLDTDAVSWANTAGLDFKREILDKAYYYQGDVFGSYLTGSRQAIAKREQDELHGFQRPGSGYLKVDSTATSLSGEGATAEFGKQGGFFQFWANASAWSPGLDFNDIGYMKETDRLYQEVGGFIFDNTPFLVANFIRAGGGVNNGWTTGGEHVDSKVNVYAQVKLKNLWDAYAETGRVFPSLDTRFLRGGPALYQDGYGWAYGQVTTDQGKRLYAQLRSYYEFNSDIGREAGGEGFKLGYTPIDRLALSADAEFDWNDYPNEYFGAAPAGVYVVGRQKRETAMLTVRAAYYVTPKLSLQYYGNPYFTVVRYSDFRNVMDAAAEKRSARFQPIAGAPGFDDPDESFGQFRSNFVFRWEYLPGSFLYLVWTHEQDRDAFYGGPSLDGAAQNLFRQPARDVVMAKVSYWFNL